MMYAILAENQSASPPAQGAWIEINFADGSTIDTPSPPAQGAWIEIITARVISKYMAVAPRTGGVD